MFHFDWLLRLEGKPVQQDYTCQGPLLMHMGIVCRFLLTLPTI